MQRGSGELTGESSRQGPHFRDTWSPGARPAFTCACSATIDLLAGSLIHKTTSSYNNEDINLYTRYSNYIYIYMTIINIHVKWLGMAIKLFIYIKSFGCYQGTRGTASQRNQYQTVPTSNQSLRKCQNPSSLSLQLPRCYKSDVQHGDDCYNWHQQLDLADPDHGTGIFSAIFPCRSQYRPYDSSYNIVIVNIRQVNTL